MKKINKKFVIVGIIVVLVIGFIGYSFINNNEQDDQTVIKENVISLTDEKQKAYQLLNVFNNQLIFQDNPHYEKGDVLVSGITDLTPNGFIRKVVQVKKEKNQYVVETTNGLLTDVFETANISKKLYLTEDGVVDDNKNENVVYKQHPSIQYLKNEKKDKVESNFKYETDEKVELEGKIAFKPWIDLSIKITHGNIQFNIIGHSKFEGSLSAIHNGSAEAEYEKELFNKNLPNFQFFVVNIPIVVTNNLSSNLESTANLEGDASLSFKVDSQRAVGYQYNSKNSKIKKINTKKYNGDGLKWQAKSKLDGHGEIYIDLHILSKLYDCTGADLSIGIAGDADGLVKADNGDYLGKLDLSVFPRVKGKVAVDLPIVDDKLKEQELFNKDLDPLWHKQWKSKKDLPKDEKSSTNTTKDQDIKLTQHFESTYGKDDEEIYSDIYDFDYPSNWTLKYHGTKNNIIYDSSNGNISVSDYLFETATIENERGVTVTFINGLEPETLGHKAHEVENIKIEKVADSQFVPGTPKKDDGPGDLSYFGRFVVGKVSIIGAEYGYGEGSEEEFEEPSVFYTIMPTSSLGLNGQMVYAFVFGDFIFEYGTNLYFSAKSPDGKFTSQEEKEVVKILSSFRHE